MSAVKPGIVGLAYVRLPAADVQASASFAEDIMGLQRSAADPGEAALRCDDYARRLVFASNAEPSLTVEAWNDASLEQLASRLETAGFPVRRADEEACRMRRVAAAIFTRDATGNAIEIVARPERSGRRFYGARDAGVAGLANVGMRSSDTTGDLRFWAAISAEVSDFVGEIAYLALDDAHHRVALYPAKGQGPLYVAFELASFDDLMRANYFLSERQVRIVQGPGRQPASDQAFLHFRGPDDRLFSYVHGMSRRPDKPRPPRSFARAAESLCAWGSRAEGAPEFDLS